MDSVSSPSIRATAGSTAPDLDLRMRLDRDYTAAARIATRNQQMVEDAAAQAGMSVEDYMRETGTMPCADYKSRPIEIPEDPMEMDYMRASAIATNKQRALEKSARALGQTPDEYMEKNGMLTDTHLAPWARW